MKYIEKQYEEDEQKVIDLSLGFNETYKLKGKATTEMQMFYSSFIVKLAKPIAKYLTTQLGESYGFNWYFINESATIKYFKNNEWHQDSLYNLI